MTKTRTKMKTTTRLTRKMRAKNNKMESATPMKMAKTRAIPLRMI